MTTVEFTGRFHVAVPTRDGLAKACDQVMAELLKLEETCDISDTAVSMEADTSTVQIEVVANGDTFEAADELANSCVRAAIHGTGGATLAWRNYVTQERRAELVDA